MRHLLCGIQFAALAFVSVLPGKAAAETARLTPSSAWNADFGDEKCRLALIFGEGKDRHLLYFEQYYPSSRVVFTVSGPKFKGFKEKRPVLINFGDQQKPRTTNPYIGSVDGLGKAVIYSALRLTLPTKRKDAEKRAPRRRLDFEAVKGAKSVTLKQGHREVVFATGELHDPVKVLDHCAQNLVKVWGLDPEKQRTKSRAAKMIDADAVKERIRSFYPRSARRNGEQGNFRFRVMLDETGAVTDCKLNNATQFEKFQPRACGLLSEASYVPALDADGNPMKSYYVLSASYRLN